MNFAFKNEEMENKDMRAMFATLAIARLVGYNHIKWIRSFPWEEQKELIAELPEVGGNDE